MSVSIGMVFTFLELVNVSTMRTQGKGLEPPMTGVKPKASRLLDVDITGMRQRLSGLMHWTESGSIPAWSPLSVTRK